MLMSNKGLKNILLASLKDIPEDIYLFGSWARNEEKRSHFSLSKENLIIVKKEMTEGILCREIQ